MHKTQDEDQQNIKHNYCVVFSILFVFVLCLVHSGVQHILCCVLCFVGLRLVSCVWWCQNTTQYLLDTTMHKTQDEDQQNIKHNTICVGHHHTKDTRRRQTKQKTQHNICWTLVLCLVYGGVQHILCCIFYFVCLRLVSCVWWCPTHIVLCFMFCWSSSCVLCIVVSNKYCVVFFALL
jgi:hypothetical protein